MDPRQLKSIGIILGLAVIALAGLHLKNTWHSDDTNWYLIVMICGMLLLLFYSIRSPKRRRRR